MTTPTPPRSSEPELLACPFCGAGGPRLSHDVRRIPAGTYYNIVCLDCGATSGEQLGKTRAARAWNNRAALQATPAAASDSQGATVEDYRGLVENVIRNLDRNMIPNERPQYRWAVAMEVLAVGSTRAKCLCESFGLDPNEQISGYGEAASPVGREPEVGQAKGEDFRDLVGRVLYSLQARPRRRSGVFWGNVADTFCVGSTRAKTLCETFSIDPDTGADVPATTANQAPAGGATP